MKAILISISCLLALSIFSMLAKIGEQDSIIKTYKLLTDNQDDIINRQSILIKQYQENDSLKTVYINMLKDL